VYTTRDQLDTEMRLLRAAAQIGAPAVAPERAAPALDADRARVEAQLWREHARCRADEARTGADQSLSTAGLTDDQAQTAYGVLTSGPRSTSWSVRPGPARPRPSRSSPGFGAMLGSGG
jgi:hypothetical protein